MEESYCWWSITRHNPYPVLEGVEQQLSGGAIICFSSLTSFDMLQMLRIF